MPLNPQQQQQLNVLQNLSQEFVLQLDQHAERIRRADAIKRFDTRGQPLNLSKLSMGEIQDMFDIGRNLSATNEVDTMNNLSLEQGGGRVLDFQYGSDYLVQHNITSSRGPDSKSADPVSQQPEVIIPASRKYMEAAIGEWMESLNHAPNSRELLQAEMTIRDSPGGNIGVNRNALTEKYQALQQSVKEETGEEFHDASIEESIQVLKASQQAFEEQALAFKENVVKHGPVLGVEFAAAMNLDAKKVAFEINEVSDIDKNAKADLSGAKIQGLDLSKSDLSRVQIDAETLSRADGLDSVRGVEPQLLAEAQAIKPHVEKLDQLRGELKAIEGKKNNLLHNYDKKREKLQADIQLEEQAMQQAREGVEQQFAVENEFEPKSSYRLGPDVSRRPVGVQDLRILDQQASVTYSVNSPSALNDQGSKLGFAKQQIGTKSSDLKKQGAEESQIVKAKNQEWNALGMMGVLHGNSEAVQALDIDRMDFDTPQSVQQVEQAVGGNLSTLLSRSVATSVVDKALGMNSMAVEKIAVDENNKCVGLSVGVPGQPVLKRPDNLDKQEDCLDIDYSEPAIQKGFYDLEAQDYITGQIDRHTGNIFVDPHSGQVSGIDNDLAFPTINREEMIQKSKLGKKTVPGMPQFLHSDTADKIEALTPESLRESLSNMELPDGVAPLEPEAIEGAVQRLGELQAEIKQMRREGRVVSAFTPQTFEAAMQKQLDQQQKQSPNEPNEIGADDGVTRTSYLAAACIEKEKSIREGKRNLIKANQVQKAPAIDPKLNAYQQGVQAAKQNLLNNPQQIQNAPLAAVIMKAPAQIQALRQQLDRETNNLAVISGQIRDAEAALEAAQTPEARQKVQKKVNDLNGAFDRTQEQRQTTLQNLAAAQKKLDQALDQAVKPQKQQIAEHARNAFVVGFKPQTQQGPIMGRRPPPQNNNNLQPSQRPVPPPRNTNNNIQPSQRPVPPPRNTNNNIQPSQRPVPPPRNTNNNNNGPTRVNTVRNDQRKVTIQPGAVQPVDNNNNIQPSRRPAPVLVRGALPPPNNNNNQQSQQHGTAVGSTGDSLRRSGERSTSPRPQLANSTGTNIKRSPPPPPPKKGFGSGPPP